jgi:hypothetical protein
LAGADDVLVSQAVRDLAIGCPIEFDTPRRFRLKGIPGEWNLAPMKK